MITESKKQIIDQRHVKRMYAVLSLLSIMIMVVAAYITYGDQTKEVTVTIPAKAQEQKSSQNALKVGADLSRIPDDAEIERILNAHLPHVCDACEDDDILDCLDRYEINKVLVQEKAYKDQLLIDVLTGKEPKKYTVVIDLVRNNAVIKTSGSIDKKECIESEEENDVEGDEVMLNDGSDPNSTTYIKR